MGTINVDPIRPSNVQQFDHKGSLSGFGAVEYWRYISDLVEEVDGDAIGYFAEHSEQSDNI